ncbi:protein neuralized-like, partial [Anneissia japonica]|uniref:protein neuralized-like n=1 Tax=Anneissia japonica TaxID=1529436 RepID=UPI001425A334
MQFHSVHGKNIELSQDATCAVRTSSFNYGILFGKEPTKPDQKVTVEITNVISGWSGGLRYGFTNVDPSTHAADNLPPYAIPNLSSKPQYHAVSLSEKHAAKGTRLSYYYTSQNTCVTFINNKPFKTENMSKIDVTKPVWLLLDVYGCTKGIKAVVS